MSRQKVKVVVRVRPQLCEEENTWVQVTSDKNLQTLNHRNLGETLQYEFERVFDPSCGQLSVYNSCVKPLLSHTLQGQNTSVFAYGPTGAGKTHTILGTGSDPGIIPRCVKDVFNLLHEEKSQPDNCSDFLVTFSYLEIYQEKVYDLLEPKPVDLPIREDQNKNIFVTGLCEHKIENVQEFNERFAPASKNRTTAATKLNERSSRSHSMLMLKILKTQTQPPYRKFAGKLYIIDLAGSEDNRKTGNHGVRLKESGAINSSLLALGQVVDALNKGQACVQYRSSKLTRILQDSLGGNSHACMIVNLAPEEKYYFDTYTTLLFARKTKKIVNTISTNEIKENRPKQKSLKRAHSSDSKDIKKKEESSTSSQEVTPTKKPRTDMEPKQLLSPLIRNQEQFKSELRKEMFSRLELLENRLLGQMKPDSPTGQSEGESMLPDSTTDEEEGKGSQLNEAMDKLNSLLSKIEQFKSTKEELVTETGLKPKNIQEDGKDETAGKKPCTKSSAMLKKGKVYSDGSSDKFALSDLSNSPLFFKPPALKRKGFKSSAAKEENSDATENNQQEKYISDAQRNHNERILNLLNSGAVKELLDLQTVGAKRAKLIHSWREIHGPFTTFDDLTNVPGLTSKYLQSFLKSNLVQV